MSLRSRIGALMDSIRGAKKAPPPEGGGDGGSLVPPGRPHPTRGLDPRFSETTREAPPTPGGESSPPEGPESPGVQGAEGPVRDDWYQSERLGQRPIVTERPPVTSSPPPPPPPPPRIKWALGLMGATILGLIVALIVIAGDSGGDATTKTVTASEAAVDEAPAAQAPGATTTVTATTPTTTTVTTTAITTVTAPATDSGGE